MQCNCHSETPLLFGQHFSFSQEKVKNKEKIIKTLQLFYSSVTFTLLFVSVIAKPCKKSCDMWLHLTLSEVYDHIDRHQHRQPV